MNDPFKNYYALNVYEEEFIAYLETLNGKFGDINDSKLKIILNTWFLKNYHQPLKLQFIEGLGEKLFFKTIDNWLEINYMELSRLILKVLGQRFEDNIYSISNGGEEKYENNVYNQGYDVNAIIDKSLNSRDNKQSQIDLKDTIFLDINDKVFNNEIFKSLEQTLFNRILYV